MGTKSLKVDELRLDLKNPRIAEASSQRDALQKILDDQDVKPAALAESIVESGLNPRTGCWLSRRPTSPATS